MRRKNIYDLLIGERSLLQFDQLFCYWVVTAI